MMNIMGGTVIETASERVKREEAEAIAKKMLIDGNLSYEKIAEYTGVSLEKVKKIDVLQTV